MGKLASVVAKKDGVALLSIGSELSDSHTLRRALMPILHGLDEPTAEEVIQEAERLRLSFWSEIRNSSLVVDSMFDRSGRLVPSSLGKALLSFLLRVDWEALPESRKQRVAEVIQDLVRQNGQRRLCFLDSYIWFGRLPELVATRVPDLSAGDKPVTSSLK